MYVAVLVSVFGVKLCQGPNVPNPDLKMKTGIRFMSGHVIRSIEEALPPLERIPIERGGIQKMQFLSGPVQYDSNCGFFRNLPGSDKYASLGTYAMELGDRIDVHTALDAADFEIYFVCSPAEVKFGDEEMVRSPIMRWSASGCDDVSNSEDGSSSDDGSEPCAAEQIEHEFEPVMDDPDIEMRADAPLDIDKENWTAIYIFGGVVLLGIAMVLCEVGVKMLCKKQRRASVGQVVPDATYVAEQVAPTKHSVLSGNQRFGLHGIDPVTAGEGGVSVGNMAVATTDRGEV